MNDSIRSIAAIMKDINSVLIYPHINSDADALGSSTALCMALRSLGKKAYVLIDEPVAKNLDFLECGCTTTDDSILSDVELSLMLDCNSMNRIRGREAAFERGRLKGCLDHHAVGVSDIKFDFLRVEAKAAATAELVFQLIRNLDVEITLEIANCLFAAITTDTGNFQHNNTTKRTHEIVGKLYEVEGFDSKCISALIYDRQSKEALRMEAKMLSDLEFAADGRIAMGFITQKLLAECNCTMDEAEGMIQRIMSIDGVEVGVLFKESPDNLRASLRAKSYANVADVANCFGGGGHIKAAGCSFSCSIDEAKGQIIPLLEAAVKK